MLLPLFLALSLSADAASEMVIKTRTPVLVYVDGKQAGLTGKLQMRATNLPAGTVNVRVASMFGKTLYKGEWELEDWTIHQAEWRNQTLSLVSTTRVPGAPPATPEVAPAPEPAVTTDDNGPEPTSAAPALAIPAGPPAPPQPTPAPATTANATPPDAVLPSATVPPPPSGGPADGVPTSRPSQPRPISITASDGTRVEVLHGDSRVVVLVEDGVLSIVDDTGTSIAFGAPPPAPAPAPSKASLAIVSTDGQPATVIVDDAIVGTIESGELQESVQLAGGSHLIELRDPTTGRRMHRGILTIEEGETIAIRYSETTPPVVTERPEAWKPL